MYILQKVYNEITPSEDAYTAVLILPSTPPNEMTRFAQLVQSVFKALNEESRDNKSWVLKVLNQNEQDRSPESNYSCIYNADIVIAECSEKKPNVFYMIGIAHAVGRPVCSCYKIVADQKADIPFNVYGRQSMMYSLSTIGHQKDFKKHLTEWIKQYEKN